MKINGTAVRVANAKNNIVIDYQLQIAEDGTIHSIDRGELTDYYECEFTFRGTRAEIDNIIMTVRTSRATREQIVLTECAERYFGENVVHAGSINCVVSGTGRTEVYSHNSYTYTVKLMATGLAFDGDAVLPDMTCEQNSSSGGPEWNTRVNSTYYGDNYFTDRQLDTQRFTGRYILNRTDMRDLMAFHKTQRGAPFTIDEGDFGVTNMFGIDNGNTEYDVVIESLTYNRISPISFEATLTLLRAL